MKKILLLLLVCCMKEPTVVYLEEVPATTNIQSSHPGLISYSIMQYCTERMPGYIVDSTSCPGAAKESYKTGISVTNYQKEAYCQGQVEAQPLEYISCPEQSWYTLSNARQDLYSKYKDCEDFSFYNEITAPLQDGISCASDAFGYVDWQRYYESGYTNGCIKTMKAVYPNEDFTKACYNKAIEKINEKLTQQRKENE